MCGVIPFWKSYNWVYALKSLEGEILKCCDYFWVGYYKCGFSYFCMVCVCMCVCVTAWAYITFIIVIIKISSFWGKTSCHYFQTRLLLTSTASYTGMNKKNFHIFSPAICIIASYVPLLCSPFNSVCTTQKDWCLKTSLYEICLLPVQFFKSSFLKNCWMINSDTFRNIKHILLWFLGDITYC